MSKTGKALKSSKLPSWEFHPIGVVRTAFAEKFGIPRQPGMVSEAKGVIQLRNEAFLSQAVRKLETFSHLWILFVFHEHGAREWKPSIRPPRLGGRKRVGVLASRSPHRPNPIGLSAVRLDRIDFDHPDGVQIHVSGVDLLDGTPVLDLKPYLPFADSIPDADAGWASEPIARHPVEFTEEASRAVERCEKRLGVNVRTMVIEMLELDPRPASQKRKIPPEEAGSEGSRFAFTLFDFDVKWEIRGGGFRVLDLVDGVDGQPRDRTKSKKLD